MSLRSVLCGLRTPFTRWRSCFRRRGTGGQFLQLLSDYVRRLLGATAVLLHEQRVDGKMQISGFSSISNDAEGRRVWVPAAEDIEKSLSAKRSEQVNVLIGGRQHARLMVPFFEQGEAPVCLTAYLPPERVAFADPCFAMLHLTTQFIVQRDLIAAAHESDEAFQQATLLVEMFTRTGDADTFKRSLFTLATELEKFFGCQRVAIGTGTNHTCRVHAVSGMSSEEKRTLGFSQLGAAMRESIALGEIMVWPGQDDLIKEVVVSANHDDLLHSFKSGRLIVAPLRHDASGFSGAVALLWPAGSPPVNRRTYRLICACQPHLAALVSFLRKSKPGAFLAEILKFWRGGLTKRITAVAGAVTFVVAMLFPVTYRVPADCRVQPVMRRTVAAPLRTCFTGVTSSRAMPSRRDRSLPSSMGVRFALVWLSPSPPRAPLSRSGTMPWFLPTRRVCKWRNWRRTVFYLRCSGFSSGAKILSYDHRSPGSLSLATWRSRRVSL